MHTCAPPLDDSPEEDAKHCWHVTMRTEFLAYKQREVYSQCCFCGITKQENYTLVPDPQHGPYAPVDKWALL